MTRGTVTGPLNGVRVLDLSWLLPGPFCTQVLADLGADVIKVERPGSGDYYREMYAGAFAVVNRNKRSIALDLKTDAGRASFESLLGSAHVLVEAFRPGVAARLGIGYETLKVRHPRLIYASLSGYGQTGPYALVPGHDINYLALAGALSIPGHWGEAPRRNGVPIGDLSAALYCVINIMAALRDCESTGKGCYIDLAIADAVLHWSQVRFADYAGKWVHADPGNDIYTTADGRSIAVGLVEDKFWHNFCRAVGRDDLLELNTRDGAAGQEAMLARKKDVMTRIFAERDLASWERLLAEHDVPASRVNDPHEAVSDLHFQTRGIVSRFVDPVTGRTLDTVSLPGGAYGKGPFSLPPKLGEHTEEILAELENK